MILEKAVACGENRIFMAGTAGELGIKNIDPKTHVMSHATILMHPRDGVRNMLVEIDEIGNEKSFFTSMKWQPGLI